MSDSRSLSQDLLLSHAKLDFLLITLLATVFAETPQSQHGSGSTVVKRQHGRNSLLFFVSIGITESKNLQESQKIKTQILKC